MRILRGVKLSGRRRVAVVAAAVLAATAAAGLGRFDLLGAAFPGAAGVIHPFPEGLREGDVVLMRGSSGRARAVIASGERYSHAGMVVMVKDRPALIHAAPPRDDDPGGVVCQDLAELMADASVVRADLFRVRVDDQAARAAAERARRWWTAGVAFDDGFDLRTPDKLYCTELVMLAYSEAGVELVRSPPRRVGVPGYMFDVILPGQLADSPMADLVCALKSARGESP